jgi:succinate dehydrogenase / fumarate reductase cytochrome b subunit
VLSDNRPVYLNLLKIRLPSTGIVSFAHRVSGFLLFLAIPFSIYLLDLSVTSQQRFDDVTRLLQHPFLQVVLLILVWALVHHFLAGIRYLFLDFDIGVEKVGSRISAWLVLAAEILIVAAYLWGVSS